MTAVGAADAAGSAFVTQLDDLRKSLLEALTASADQTRQLASLLQELPPSASSHDYANLMCQRVAETHAIKHYLRLQNEFFEMLKAEAPPVAEPEPQLAEDIGRERRAGPSEG